MGSRLRTCRIVAAGALAVGALGGSATPASADHHLMLIGEFHPGTAATANDAFLELQMYAAGQNQVGGHEVHVYPAGSGGPGVFVFNPAAIIPNGENQRTVLAGGSNVPGRDLTENFDGVGSPLDPLGGAICFVSAEGFGTIDCVEWGSGNTNVSAGTPVLPGGIPDGMSITRSIAPNCPTLLEAGDDTNDSATDFSLTTPSPRNNASPIVEVPCDSGGGPDPGPSPGPVAGDTTPPETTITGGPKKKQKKGKATFSFSSSEPGSTFECKLDNGAFEGCTTPRDIQVKKGKHTFSVRAIDAAGNVDSTPAIQDWTVKKKKKK